MPVRNFIGRSVGLRGRPPRTSPRVAGDRPIPDTDEELAERHVLVLRAQQQVEVDHIGVGGSWGVDRDLVFLFRRGGTRDRPFPRA
jgi:hypothetical protein